MPSSKRSPGEAGERRLRPSHQKNGRPRVRVRVRVRVREGRGGGTHVRRSFCPSRASRSAVRNESERKKEFLQTGYFLQGNRGCPRQESNLCTRFRKPRVVPRNDLLTATF